MQAREVLLLDSSHDPGGLECAGGDVGIEGFENAADYDKSVGFGTGREGFECARHTCGVDCGRLCLTSGVSGERSESAARRG